MLESQGKKKRQNKIRIKQNKIHMMVETLENKEKNKTLVVIKNCIYKWKIQVEFFLHETEKDTNNHKYNWVWKRNINNGLKWGKW